MKDFKTLFRLGIQKCFENKEIIRIILNKFIYSLLYIQIIYVYFSYLNLKYIFFYLYIYVFSINNGAFMNSFLFVFIS